MPSLDVALREIIEALLLLPNPTHDEAHRIKLHITAKHHLSHVPSNSELISVVKPHERSRLIPILRRKNTRTISGVTVVAVMTKPHDCPQPEPCAYCPGGTKTGSPQSYTGHEPAAMRESKQLFALLASPKQNRTVDGYRSQSRQNRTNSYGRNLPSHRPSTNRGSFSNALTLSHKSSLQVWRKQRQMLKQARFVT